VAVQPVVVQPVQVEQAKQVVEVVTPAVVEIAAKPVVVEPKSDLQQVETVAAAVPVAAAADSADATEPARRPSRRRRPAAKAPESEGEEMVQIETKAERLKREAMEAESGAGAVDAPPKRTRAPRQKPAIVEPGEPLMQVETHRTENVQ
jgi:hypothetical protein